LIPGHKPPHVTIPQEMVEGSNRRNSLAPASSNAGIFSKLFKYFFTKSIFELKITFSPSLTKFATKSSPLYDNGIGDLCRQLPRFFTFILSKFLGAFCPPV